MSGQGKELIATDESTVVTKPLLDAVIVQDGQSDRRLADSASTDKSNWGEIFRETDDLLDQLVASEEDSRWRGWGFSGYTGLKYKTPAHW